MQQCLKHLCCDLAQQNFVHSPKTRLFDVSVQVEVEKLENNNVVSSEIEAVEHFDDSILVRVFAKNSFQELGLNPSVISLLLSMFANLYC